MFQILGGCKISFIIRSTQTTAFIYLFRESKSKYLLHDDLRVCALHWFLNQCCLCSKRLHKEDSDKKPNDSLCSLNIQTLKHPS